METTHGSLHSRHGSWLNQAEIEIGLLARQCLAKRRIPTLAMLQREAAAWNAKATHDGVRINWQFTRKSPPEIQLQTLKKKPFHAVIDLVQADDGAGPSKRPDPP